MEVDVILLTYTKNDEIYNMTKNCIESIINSENNTTFKIHLIETDKTGKYGYDYKEVNLIVPNGEFNYNKFLNIGLEYCANDWILISNNDTEYRVGWFTEMMKQYEKDTELLSMSPYCPIWHVHKQNFNRDGREIYYGNRTSYELTGWSILLNKKVIDIMGNFDERFSFWYQDNDYSMNLSKHKIKHALIKNSVVLHFVSKSHGLLGIKKVEMTHGLNKTFQNKWK